MPPVYDATVLSEAWFSMVAYPCEQSSGEYTEQPGRRQAITEELNRKLSNRVLYSVGLCIALHDIVKLEESFILPGDGASHSRTTFRYVVFRPYVDEVLTGRIKSCSSDGVQGSR
ncbi:DNA-directed RNA polymerase III subunit RPC8-like, partial [Amphibalanus amphitrite]|uniref:DNA-directed RNA polymerase III subunit RPC8-like n=1 Tax=Amphibalanus amphitrite TaxID=1232801 RepID=UPI001C91CBFB